MDNKVTLSLEFDLSAIQQGWNQVMQWGMDTKKQLNGLFVDTNTFMPFNEMLNESKSAGIGIEDLQNKVKKLEQQLETLRTKSSGSGGGLPQFTQLSGNARMAVSSLNYTLQDSGMFFVNFRMGMMSISNNIPMLLQGLRGMKTEADAANKSFKNYVIDSFSGPNSILIWISLLSMAMVALPAIFDNTTESAKKQKDALKELRDEYSKLTQEQLNNRVTTYKSQLAEIEARHPNTTEMRQIGGIKSERFERVKLTDEERFGPDYARVAALKEQVKLAEQTLLDLGKQEDVENRIRLNREKLLKMNENPQSKNYWKNLVPDATDYNNARTLLDKWIETDEKIYGKNKDKKKEHIPTAQELYDQEMEKLLPKSGYDAVKNLTEEDDILDDIKIKKMDEIELDKIRIMGIEDEFQRRRELADWELEAAKEKYKNYVNYEQIIAAYEKENELQKKEINIQELKQQEAKLQQEKAMYSELGSFIKDELTDAFGQAFDNADGFASRFFNRLLNMALDFAMKAALQSLLVPKGVGADFLNPLGGTLNVLTGLLAKQTGGSVSVDDQLNSALLSKSTTPASSDIKVISIQPDLSSIRDEIRSWSREVNFSWNYDQLKATLKTYDHRQSYEE